MARLDRNFRRVDNMSGREMEDIIAFMEALTDPSFDRTIPTRVPSGLPVGGLWARTSAGALAATAQGDSGTS